MKKERKKIGLDRLQLNEGRIPWLPKNPRQWTQTDIDKTRDSLIQDPDFLDDRPILVVPFGKEYVVFAGNLRHEGALAAKWVSVPCVVHYPETEEDRDTVLRRAMKDNGSFGSWDWDEVFSSPWGTMDLEALGIGKAFEANGKGSAQSDMGLSTENGEVDEEYDAFVDKFKPKLTTDDCYTPPAVFDAILNFVGTITEMRGKRVVRPFFPGADYEDMSQYSKDCIVVDNPPFSILSKILRFYCQHNVRFFLFAPSLTLFSAPDCDLTYIIANADIVYENGANVRTGFITNLIPDLRIWVCPELGESVAAAQETEDKTKRGFVYPDNIVTAATLQKLAAHATELKIRKRSCEYINESDSAKEQGRCLFGGGFILSDYAAAERAAAERAAAERAAATRLNLSDREKAIIARLNEQDKETDD